jgi:sulfide:quinone oxidoreductase
MNNGKYFSQHSKVIIIGAGTGGITTANQLIQGKNFNNKDITIFDPLSIHYYQPGFTKIAGLHGMDKLISKNISYDMKDITKNFNFKNWAVKEFDPENNTIIDEHGGKWTYDQLIVASGIKIDLDKIPGKYLLNKPNEN